VDHFNRVKIRFGFRFIPHAVTGGVERLAAERKERLAVYLKDPLIVPILNSLLTLSYSVKTTRTTPMSASTHTP